MKVRRASEDLPDAVGVVSAGIWRFAGYNAGLRNLRFLAGQTDIQVSLDLDWFHSGHQITFRTFRA